MSRFVDCKKGLRLKIPLFLMNYCSTMRERLNLLIKYYIFWISFFLVSRLLFLAYNYEFSSTLSLTDFLLVNLHGLHIDFSAMGYIVVVPTLLFAIPIKGKYLNQVLQVYSIIILFFSCLIVVTDLELYKHWGFRMDSTPLLYLSPEALQTSSLSSLFLLVTLFFLFFSFSVFTYYKIIRKPTIEARTINGRTVASIIVILPLLIIPIRGSFDIAPMRVSKVYFHPSNNYANHAAINVLWNVGYDLKNIDKLKYPENFFDKEKTVEISEKIFKKPVKTFPLIKGEKPNIILIILESYTYKFIEPLGGLPDVAPNLNKLSKEGVLFTDFYSSGDRTDKGIISILSGYPAQTKGSIIKFPKKMNALPSLAETLKGKGYSTSFTYGGNPDFANFRAYLSQAGFEKLITEEDFPGEQSQSKWGVHDHIVFEKFYNDLSNNKQPFFDVLLTLSSHEPFDVPIGKKFEGDDDETLFKNSAYYTDSALGEFINKVKNEDWWENTLVIITADHGHRLPENHHQDKFRIPMLWLGGALAVTDTVINKIASQTDIPNTILSQLSAFNPNFIFSRDINASNYEPFAVYVYKDGFGMIREGNIAEYDMIQNRYIYGKGEISDFDKILGKAYIQRLFTDYNSR